MKIAIVGGLGYIGRHLAVDMLNSNYELLIIDNCSNSEVSSVDNIKQIAKKNFEFVKMDISDHNLSSILNCDLVVHLASFKSVSESETNYKKYFQNNVGGTYNLLNVMEQKGIKNIIFSSSATVYGKPNYIPLDENHSLSPENFYGETKLICEQMIKSLYGRSLDGIAILRYFNPIGSHHSGLLDDTKSENIMPQILKVISGDRAVFEIYGNDYNTRDGTGERDYIHINDLVDAHIKSINHIVSGKNVTLNIGTGKGTTVMELLKTVSKVTNKQIPFIIKNRRNGDLDSYYAKCDLANDIIGWKAKYDIEQMIKDSIAKEN